MVRGRIAFYVQHLLGTGHLRRAALIVRALARQGHEAYLVSGGMPVADLEVGGARFYQLPPVCSGDERFSHLVDHRGTPVTPDFKRHRCELLLKRFVDLDPDALVVESFPFGRRSMRFELLPLLRAARAQRRRPWVIASVRDIVQAKRKPGRAEETLDLLNRWYNFILVHGDPSLAEFKESFPMADHLRPKLHYTGFVAKESSAYHSKVDVGTDEVIVSAGGGAFGVALLATAVEARGMSSLADRTWRLLVGEYVSDEQANSLLSSAGPGVVVERARPDFPELLSNCVLSISQAGYNTVMDMLRSGAPAVLVPFRGHEETEQMMRAQALQKMGRIEWVDETQLTPARLAQAVDAAMAKKRCLGTDLDLNGADKSAELIGRWANRERHGADSGL